MPAKIIINTAISTALQSEEDYKVGAVLYRGPNIIKACSNNKKYIGYRKNIFEFLPTRHGEISVLHGVRKDVLKNSNMVIARVNKYGMLASAKPCLSCIKAIQIAGVKKIYYSTYNGDFVKIKVSDVVISEWEKECPSDWYNQTTIELRG